MDDTFFQDNRTGEVRRYKSWLATYKESIMNELIIVHRMIEVRKTENGWEEA